MCVVLSLFQRHKIGKDIQFDTDFKNTFGSTGNEFSWTQIAVTFCAFPYTLLANAVVIPEMKPRVLFSLSLKLLYSTCFDTS